MKRVLRQISERLCGISNYDRKAEALYHKMRRLHKKGGFINELRAKRIESLLMEKYNLTLRLSAQIGENFQIRHPHGIRIGRTAIIGDNCKVYPFFTAVAALKNDKQLNEAHMRRHPKIGNDCLLGLKATVIGPVTIGDDVTIGACAVVTKDVPSHSVVKGTNMIRPKRLEEVPDKYKEEYKKFLEKINK